MVRLEGFEPAAYGFEVPTLIKPKFRKITKVYSRFKAEWPQADFSTLSIFVVCFCKHRISKARTCPKFVYNHDSPVCVDYLVMSYTFSN